MNRLPAWRPAHPLVPPLLRRLSARLSRQRWRRYTQESSGFWFRRLRTDNAGGDADEHDQHPTIATTALKAAIPFWARLACHRRRRLESFRSPWAGKRRIFLPPSSLVPKIRLRAIAWPMVVNATSAPHWSRRSPLVIVLGTEPPLVSVFVFGRRVVARVHGAHGSGAICRELGVMHGGFQST